LGYDDPAIRDAYRQAMDRKLYVQVETRAYHFDGPGFVTSKMPAYAGTTWSISPS
jgi:hypothetical protein